MFSGDRKVSFHLKLSLIHVGLREIILRYTKNNTFLVNIIDNVMLFFIFAKCYGMYACDLGRMQQMNKKVCAPCIFSLLAYLLLGLHARSYAK